MKFLNFTSRYSSCEIGEFVRFVKDIGGDLVDRKVGDLDAEERVELCDMFENGKVMRFSTLTIEMSCLCKKHACMRPFFLVS